MSEKRAEYDIPLFPVAGWDVGRSEAKGLVLLRMLYAAGPSDTAPHQALMHSMTPEQAKELARELLNATHNVVDGAL